jgi:perosamine synthetase
VSGQIRLSKKDYQDPAFKRHDTFGFMYRLPEVAAAMGLGQLEKLDSFVEKREKMAKLYHDVIKDCDWLEPQKTPEGDRNSYYTFAAKFLRDDITWYDFRDKHIENGGDGIYAAWTLCYLEDSIEDIRNIIKPMGLDDRLNTDKGICPTAERIQPELMQFTTNQKNEEEREKQADILRRTIKSFS